MIKKFFNEQFILNDRPAQSVMAAAAVITLAGIASRILGLLRDRFLASTFGAGDTLDIYYAAFRFPDLVYNLLIVGALSAAFVPVFTGLISKEKEDEAWALANQALSILVVSLVFLCLILAAFVPLLMRLITPGFPEEKMESVVMFTRIMFLSPIFLGISGLFGGILTSFKRFLVYSVAPIMYNCGIIFGVLVLVRFFGPIGLAWGVVLGAFLHMLTQLPAVKNLGFNFGWDLLRGIRSEYVKKIFNLMVPRVVGVAVTQINLMVITIFASTLAAGSLAILNFSQNLQSVPLGIFGVSFAIAAFPVLSTLAAQEKRLEFVGAFSKTFRQILFFVIPLSVFMLVLRAQLVRVVLGAGKFDWEDTILTFECLGVFVLSLFAQSTIPLLARSFYALQDTKTPLYIALVAEAVNIIAVLLLIGEYDVLGLAMAFSISSVIQMLILLFMLRTRFDDLDDRRIVVSVVKITTAAFLAGLTIQFIKYAVSTQVDLDTFFGIFAQLVVSLSFGLFVFLGMSYTLELEEFFNLKNSLTRKLFRSKHVITESTDDVSGI